MRSVELLRRLDRGDLQNVQFAELQRLMEELGFVLDRVRGSHHLYWHSSLRLRLNLQPCKGEAKPYQIRQLMALVAQYHLHLEKRT